MDQIDDREDHSSTEGGSQVSRRTFIQSLGLSAAAAGALSSSPTATAETHARWNRTRILGPEPVTVTLSVNWQKHQLTIDPATTLLEMLREHLNLIGAKEICGRGACGGCLVLMGGIPVSSCMTLAVDAIGQEVTTVESMAVSGTLDPLQESFLRHDALQCGYCTPGMLIAARALLDENPQPTLDEIKREMSGNFCRCGSHSNVFNAILEASGQSPMQDSGGAQ